MALLPFGSPPQRKTKENFAYRLLGVNFGHDQVGTGSVLTAQNTADFAVLAQYTKRLRIAMPAHDDATGVADMKTIALAALAYGFEVSVGVVVATGSNLTSYNAWKNTNVAALALWASTNRVRNFYIGNEEDYWASQGTIAGGAITATIVRTDVKALAASLKASYPELTILYATADTTIDDWNNDSNGVGTLDGIGINLYATSAAVFETRLATLAQREKLAPTLFVSEWASQNPYPDGMTDNNYRDAIYSRYRSIQKWGLEAYFFTWRMGGGSDWGVMSSDGSHKPGYEEVFGLTNYHTLGDFEQGQYRFPNGAILSQNLSEVGALLNSTLHVTNSSSGLDVYVLNTANDANFNVETSGVGKAAFMTLASTNDSYIGFTFYVSGSLAGRWGRNGDNGGMYIYTGAGSLTKAAKFDNSQNTTLFGQLTTVAGTTSLAPIIYPSGTNLTSATAGATEYDGNSQFFTNDTSHGRGLVPVEQKFRLTATGSTISTIANYFGANSNISLVSGGEYEIEIDCWFLKTTAGTVTWTFTNSAAPTSMAIEYKFSAAAGIVTAPAATNLFGDQYNVTAAAPTVVSASLTTAVNHHHKFWIRLINGTGTSLKIQATASAGTITPGINSSWRARRIPSANIGTFAA